MSENILEKIIKNKIKKIDILKKSISLDSLKDRINENKSFMNFKEKIENNIKNDKISIIAEIKKASPSSGLIIEDYNPTGTFLINDRAMMVMKEKSIKMLNI